MLATTLRNLYERDLNKLKKEISLYQRETNLWRIDKGIANSGGNCCLHLIGNLNAYIGVGLAKTNYVRQRELEFSSTNVPRTELIAMLDATMQVVDKGLSNISESRLTDDFPVLIWEQPASIEFTLVHLLAHLNYHLGQVNYHRRLLDV